MLVQQNEYPTRVFILLDGCVSISCRKNSPEKGAQIARTDPGPLVAQQLLKSSLVGVLEGSPTCYSVIGLNCPILHQPSSHTYISQSTIVALVIPVLDLIKTFDMFQRGLAALVVNLETKVLQANQQHSKISQL